MSCAPVGSRKGLHYANTFIHDIDDGLRLQDTIINSRHTTYRRVANYHRMGRTLFDVETLAVSTDTSCLETQVQILLL